MKDKTPIKIIALIVVPLVLAVVIRFSSSGDDRQKKDPDSDFGSESIFKDNSPVKIATKWLMPEELLEISGISWVDSVRFACVQDEVGKVFIYNISDNQIEREIPFGPDGDYEGVAIADQAIYVLRADGTIFGIDNYNAGEPNVKSYKTVLSKKNDSESLCYDKKNQRLLVATKAADAAGEKTKGIYAFDLRSKTMAAEPVFRIDLESDLLKKFVKKKKENAISPSDLDIHPVTGDLYILEGTKPKLAIMDANGSMKRVIELPKSDFPQPEGLTFSPEGKMYISNEGVKKEGNILEVELQSAD